MLFRVLDMSKLSDALDVVLKAAVIRKDDELIEVYREVYQGAVSGSKNPHVALRLGLLVGRELTARRTVSANAARVDPKTK